MLYGAYRRIRRTGPAGVVIGVLYLLVPILILIGALDVFGFPGVAKTSANRTLFWITFWGTLMSAAIFVPIAAGVGALVSLWWNTSAERERREHAAKDSPPTPVEKEWP